MPRTRSRPKTEARFQQAVLELLAEGGCSGIGINSVAQRAGADKVLIYRYFGSLEGLLGRVAEGREWLPEPLEMVAAVRPAEGEPDPAYLLRSVCDEVVRHLQSDPASRQALLWRRTSVNALARAFTAIWLGFWDAVAGGFSSGLDSGGRIAWREACGLVAQVVEAEVSGEPVATGVFPRIAAGLVPGVALGDGARVAGTGEEEERLPTNLL